MARAEALARTRSRRQLLKWGGGGVAAALALGSAGCLQRARSAQPDGPFLRGVNFSGKDYMPGDQWPVAEAVDYYLGQKKMNVVRLPLKWELLQPTLGGAIEPTMIAGIDEQIARVTAAGGAIILEIHNYGRRSVSGRDYVIGETPTVTAGQFEDLWRRMAGLWGQRGGVIFGLMNEPHDQDDATLVSVSNGAIAAIRSAGAANLILVNGNNWGSRGWALGASNYRFMGPKIVDPSNNFAFDIHHYFDDSSGQHDWCAAHTWQNPIKTFTAWARLTGHRAFCGEFAAGANAACNGELTSFLDYIEANRDVWLGWAWWGGGGWWSEDYIFRLDPYASYLDPKNPMRSAAEHWSQPRMDRPQMATLQHYLPPSTSAYNGPMLP